MNKKINNFKFENIKPNEKADFEMCYNHAIELISYLKNALQQLVAAHKNLSK